MRVRFPSAASDQQQRCRFKEGMRARGQQLIVTGVSVLALGALALGCGGDSNQGSEAADAALIDWPTFGRVSERTHYLPT